MREAGIDPAARWLAEKARVHFLEARAILAAKPKGRLIAPRLMEEAYSHLLSRMIARGWDAPRVRMRTSKWRLGWLALHFWLLG
jgi:phytoene synthase